LGEDNRLLELGCLQLPLKRSVLFHLLVEHQSDLVDLKENFNSKLPNLFFEAFVLFLELRDVAPHLAELSLFL